MARQKHTLPEGRREGDDVAIHVAGEIRLGPKHGVRIIGRNRVSFGVSVISLGKPACSPTLAVEMLCSWRTLRGLPLF